MPHSLLQQVVHPDNLRQAWDAIAENQGMAGVDNVTVRAWRRTWEQRLVALAHAVRTGRYRPGGLRRRRIPKSNRREWRELRIPTVTDRVLQRAVLQRLYPLFEPRFLDCSFGYRPGRSLGDAVGYINRWRKQGYDWVLDADIDDFFNQVDHDLLRRFLYQDLDDHSLMPLLGRWLGAGRVADDPPRGIPMGAPISPLLANITLHRLDLALAGQQRPLVRYADDFVVLARSQEEAEESYDAVAGELADLRLRYEPTKTQITSFEEGFDFLGVHFEESWYWYTWEDKRIEVRSDDADWLFGDYGPKYN